MESGAPSFPMTSLRVVFPGLMNATSSGLIGVFNVIRMTLQPAMVRHMSTIKRLWQAQHRRVAISISKRPKPKLHPICSLGDNNVLDESFSIQNHKQIVAFNREA